MANPLVRYANWLHLSWPAGTIEKLPQVGPDGATTVPGIRVVGDLTGIPLLKFAVETGARAIRAFAAEPLFAAPRGTEMVDVAIVGGGVSGLSAALEAKRRGLSFVLLEATQNFSTIQNFPKAKPIYTYPTEMVPIGDLKVSATVKEDLLTELETQRAAAGIESIEGRVRHVERKGESFLLQIDGRAPIPARRVLVAIGRTGNYRKLGVPGEGLEKVYNRLYDPKEHAGKNVLVVGGGDSALEAAIALVACGAHVTLSHRKADFSRPKAENLTMIRRLERDPASAVAVKTPTSDRVTTSADSSMRGHHDPGSLRLLLGSEVQSISHGSATLRNDSGRDLTIPNDVAFVMIGREAPLEFFRRSGIRISGEVAPRSWLALSLFTLLMLLIYVWKAWWIGHTDIFALGTSWGLGRESLLGAFSTATRSPGFWFTLAYSACIVGFGTARIRRRRTPYVTRQTLTLMAIQVVPLFLLPEIILPWMDANHWLPELLRENLFPNGEYWRAYGFILAWPLFLVNLASPHPMLWWIVIGLVQTFVLIPFIVWKWGKGAYCGWICSCGAMAETMGDTHRGKMWHGPRANRWNLLGQVILAVSIVLTALNMLAWSPAYSAALEPTVHLLHKLYKGIVDIAIGGAIGLGFYFWFSGRVWCRFACPLAALMHIYARFSRFRIFAEKSKCISCNVCTSVCHQGIDVMNFANKGTPMADPECVRCSACVAGCPTGVLSFGRLGDGGKPILDTLPASPVQMRERRG
ncbi:MAG: NAD(P)-binding domain-containing protein [Candidatus Eisenbacteria bacterium]|nr:NAD(P)-binding domain-containing protein [Candidatus Eisenbacteria bacterium]